MQYSGKLADLAICHTMVALNLAISQHARKGHIPHRGIGMHAGIVRKQAVKDVVGLFCPFQKTLIPGLPLEPKNGFDLRGASHRNERLNIPFIRFPDGSS